MALCIPGKFDRGTAQPCGEFFLRPQTERYDGKEKNRRYQRFVYFTCPVHVVSPGLIEFVQDAGEPVTSPLQLEFEDGKVVVHVIP